MGVCWFTLLGVRTLSSYTHTLFYNAAQVLTNVPSTLQVKKYYSLRFYRWRNRQFKLFALGHTACHWTAKTVRILYLQAACWVTCSCPACGKPKERPSFWMAKGKTFPWPRPYEEGVSWKRVCAPNFRGISGFHVFNLPPCILNTSNIIHWILKCTIIEWETIHFTNYRVF